MRYIDGSEQNFIAAISKVIIVMVIIRKAIISKAIVMDIVGSYCILIIIGNPAVNYIQVADCTQDTIDCCCS